MHRGRRAGIHVRRAALRVRYAGRDQGRQPDDGGRHDPRRPLGFVRLLPHGRVRRVHGREGRCQPGGPGPVRLREPPEGGRGGGGGQVQGGDPAGAGPGEERADHRRRGRGAAKGYQRGDAREAQARLPQGRRHRHGGERAGTQRRLERPRSRVAGLREVAWARAPGPRHRLRHGGRRAPRDLLRSGPRGAEPDGPRRHRHRRLRSHRGQRGLRGPGAGRRPGAGLELGPGQRARRRRGAGPPHRRERRPGAHDPAVRLAGPGWLHRARHPLSGRGNAVALSVEML